MGQGPVECEYKIGKDKHGAEDQAEEDVWQTHSCSSTLDGRDAGRVWRGKCDRRESQKLRGEVEVQIL